MQAARAEIESLLRARKLDRTLTTTARRAAAAGEVAATGWAVLDEPLGGGLRRGHLSEVIGARSSGRTTLVIRIAAAAMARGEIVALIDTHDRFDPVSAHAAGIDLRRLLWVRDSGRADRALKAMHLVLQAGGFGVVVWDLADAAGVELRQFPHTTWMRLARTIEGSTTAALLVGAEHLARSAGGATIALDALTTPAGDWIGATSRARRLSGLPICPRVIAAP